MELFKYMLHFHPYKHIAMNRFPSSQANFYHVSMCLALRIGGTNRGYAVCIHIDLTTHLGNKRIGKFHLRSVCETLIINLRFNECCHPDRYVGKTD